MEDLKIFAKIKCIGDKYPKFYDAICKFDDLIGLDDVKQRIASRIKYIIMSNPKRFKTSQSTFAIETRSKKKNKKKRKNRKCRNKLTKRTKRIKYIKPEESDEDEIRIPPELVDSILSVVTSVRKTVVKNNVNMNTLITGKPGTGKTTISKLLANLYMSLDLVNGYKMLTRGDLVGKYQGFTSANLRKLISENTGGILILDEAYGINSGDNDSFGEEAMVEIIESMTNAEKNITWFFIGYEKQINKNLISKNDGFKRRMGQTLVISSPSIENVVEIFRSEIKKSKWRIQKEENENILSEFKKNKDILSLYGGDLTNLVSFTIEDSIRNIWPNINKKKEINIKNIVSAFQRMSEGTIKEVHSTMYI
jgi:SpoVK/Ycf46/Vps4 family AAA+-type ATPase